jgi:hypothetical protein
MISPSRGAVNNRTSQWAITKAYPLVGTFIVLVSLSGCFTSHVTAEHQRALDPVSPRQASQTYLSYQVEPYGSGESRHVIPFFFTARKMPACYSLSYHAGTPGVRRVFEESFAHAAYVMSLNQKDAHVKVEVALKLHPSCPGSLLLQLWQLLAYASAFAFPYLDDDHGYFVRYQLYIDGALRHTYRYQITQKGVVWLPLGLFSWANYFTPGETDAFEETARYFVVDAERDGFFQTLSAR